MKIKFISFQRNVKVIKTERKNREARQTGRVRLPFAVYCESVKCFERKLGVRFLQGTY